MNKWFLFAACVLLLASATAGNLLVFIQNFGKLFLGFAVLGATFVLGCFMFFLHSKKQVSENG
jgi:hypothetical protein